VTCQTADGRLTALAQRFERFAQRECHVSPLYECLSRGIARDRELLSIAVHARAGQPVPNLFFAAVHYMLLKGIEHPLTAFYASLAHVIPQTDDPYSSFRAFCLEHAEEIQRLIAARLVQTNEVRRCGCLLPAFGLVAHRTAGQPLALVEIGASAGLNLLWDEYGYDYGEYGRYGVLSSAVQISCTVRGSERPPLPVVLPPVAMRVGLDINPIDVRDPDAALWLRALVWPDEAGRSDLLQRAMHIAQHNPPTLIGGNALDLLATVMARIPDDQIVLSVCFTPIPSISFPKRPALNYRRSWLNRPAGATSIRFPSNGWAESIPAWTSSPSSMVCKRRCAWHTAAAMVNGSSGCQRRIILHLDDTCRPC
jgi:hypothetical protein